MAERTETRGEDAKGEQRPSSKLEECQAALQEGRLLFIGIPGAGADLSAALKGAREFAASADLPRSAVVEFGADDAGARGILRELGRELHGAETIVLFLAPPGVLIEAFVGSPTKAELARALSGVGKCSCGSGGCC